MTPNGLAAGVASSAFNGRRQTPCGTPWSAGHLNAHHQAVTSYRYRLGWPASGSVPVICWPVRVRWSAGRRSPAGTRAARVRFRFVGYAAAGTGYLGLDEAASSAGYPAAGGRATTLRRDAYLEAAAPPTPAAAPIAAAFGSPPNANGKPNPAAPRSASGAGNGTPAGKQNSGGGGAAAQAQFGGTDIPPNEGASPVLPQAPESPANPDPAHCRRQPGSIGGTLGPAGPAGRTLVANWGYGCGRGGLQIAHDGRERVETHKRAEKCGEIEAIRRSDSSRSSRRATQSETFHVRPSTLPRPDKSVDSPEPDDVEEAAGVARLCSAWEIRPDSDACALPAAVPAAWVAAALCTADPAGFVVCGASVNGVT